MYRPYIAGLLTLGMLLFSGCSPQETPSSSETPTTNNVAAETNDIIQNSEDTIEWILPVDSSIVTVHQPLSKDIGSENGIFLTTSDLTNSQEIYGKDILASSDGTVSYVCTDYVPGQGYGIYLTISHKNDYETLYAHCSSVSVKEGDSVTQGQKIGEIGATGNTSYTGCYFQLSQNGVVQKINFLSSDN